MRRHMPLSVAVWCLSLVLLLDRPVGAFQPVPLPNVPSGRCVSSALHSRRDDREDDTVDELPTGSGVERRGMLKGFLGGVLGMAASDAVLNTAFNAVTRGDGAVATTVASALYRRVLSFGTTYEAAGAIASEDLLAWVAQGTAASTPEIQAWMAAQRKLQMVRKAATAVEAAGSAAAATSRRAAGGFVEETIMAAAAGGAARKILESEEPESVEENSRVEREAKDSGIAQNDSADTACSDSSVSKL